MRDDQTVIIEMRPRYGVLVVGFVMGCAALWAAWTGSLIGSPLGIPAGVGRWIVGGCGAVFVTGTPLLLVSNLVQKWSVLVGSEIGLQVIYPLGFHRFVARSRLEGSLEEATLTVQRVTSGSFLQPQLTYVTITADEGVLEFSFGTSGTNPDYRERFNEWLAARQTG